MIDTPWSGHRTRQVQGTYTEREIAKRRGARLHPRSGAGRIKDDASTDDTIIEIKDADRSHTLKGSVLDSLFRRAVRQGKEAQYVIYFTAVDLTATIHLKRGKG